MRSDAVNLTRNLTTKRASCATRGIVSNELVNTQDDVLLRGLKDEVAVLKRSAGVVEVLNTSAVVSVSQVSIKRTNRLCDRGRKKHQVRFKDSTENVTHLLGVQSAELVLALCKNDIKDLLGISAKIKLVEPKSIQRSEGKAKRVIDNRQW